MTVALPSVILSVVERASMEQPPDVKEGSGEKVSPGPVSLPDFKIMKAKDTCTSG